MTFSRNTYVFREGGGGNRWLPAYYEEVDSMINDQQREIGGGGGGEVDSREKREREREAERKNGKGPRQQSVGVGRVQRGHVCRGNEN